MKDNDGKPNAGLLVRVQSTLDYYLGGIFPWWVTLLLPVLFLVSVCVVALAVVGYFSFLLSPAIVSAYWGTIRAALDSRPYRIAAELLIAIVAALIYVLRRQFLVGFAASEITAGLTIAWYSLSNHYDTGLAFWVALMGSLYLLVRGIDSSVTGVAALAAAMGHNVSHSESEIDFTDAMKRGVEPLLMKHRTLKFKDDGGFGVFEYVYDPCVIKVMTHTLRMVGGQVSKYCVDLKLLSFS